MVTFLFNLIYIFKYLKLIYYKLRYRYQLFFINISNMNTLLNNIDYEK